MNKQPTVVFVAKHGELCFLRSSRVFFAVIDEYHNIMFAKL